MVSNKPVRFAELDALRGVAAVFIVIFHFTKILPEPKLLKLGVTGVDLFFIISGFVILMTLEKTSNWKDFVVSRLSRLYPTYWVCVTLTALLICINLAYFDKSSYKALGWEYVTNMTMFQQYFRVHDLDAPYWTMLVEMLFYFFMLGLFLLKKLKHIEMIGAIILIPTFIYSTPYFNNHFRLIHNYTGFYLPLINHFPLFLSGIVFYKIKFEKPLPARYLLLAACFICQLFLYDDGGRSWNYISFPRYAVMLFIYYIVFLLTFNNYLPFLKNKVLLFLGKISFSLYLFHDLVGTKIIIPGLIKYLQVNFWLAVIIALVIVITLAYFIASFIEKPAMNYIRDKYKKNSR